MKGVSPAVRNAVVALRVYATELEQERVKLDEEYGYYQSLLKNIERKGRKIEPIAQKMLKPIFEISDHMNLNLTEIEQIRRKNSELRKSIAESEKTMSQVMVRWNEITEEYTHLHARLTEYQQIFTDISTPPPLPYPYDTEWEINWAIINNEPVDLPEEWRSKCALIAEMPCTFNDLPYQNKVEILKAMKDIKGYIHEVLKEMKRIEHEVTNELRKKTLLQLCLKRYAALALSMQKVKFFDE